VFALRRGYVLIMRDAYDADDLDVACFLDLSKEAAPPASVPVEATAVLGRLNKLEHMYQIIALGCPEECPPLHLMGTIEMALRFSDPAQPSLPSCREAPAPQ